jgi:hypothetical protein
MLTAFVEAVVVDSRMLGGGNTMSARRVQVGEYGHSLITGQPRRSRRRALF